MVHVISSRLLLLFDSVVEFPPVSLAARHSERALVAPAEAGPNPARSLLITSTPGELQRVYTIQTASLCCVRIDLMNMNRRDDLRAVGVSVAVAVALSFSAVLVSAAEDVRPHQPGSVAPAAASKSGLAAGDATSVAASDVPAQDLASEPDAAAVAGPPFKSPSYSGFARVISAFFDDDGKTLTMVQFPAEHAGLLFGRHLPPDADAFAAVLAKNGVTFAVTHFPYEQLKTAMEKVGIGISAVYPALAKDDIAPLSPDCLLEEAAWSRCYKGGIDLGSWYQARYPSQDLDPSFSRPKLWKWRSLSPHMHTGYDP